MRIALVSVSLLLGVCVTQTWSAAVSPQKGILEDLGAIRRSQIPLRWDIPVQGRREADGINAEVGRYFSFYGLDLPCERHAFGYIPVGVMSIATHVYVPQGQVRGTVVAAHGYFDHTATWRHAISVLLESGFAVVIYDQPGHGLSSGERATIGSFSQYVQVLNAIVSESRQHLPDPHHLAAHSMGCAAAVDYLLSDPEAADIDKVVLVAPLVRSSHWHLANSGQWIAKGFVSSVRRKFRRNASDQDYLDFVKADPLHAKRIPFGWLEALKRWNRRATAFRPKDRQILLIQGDRDATVDFKFNLPFLKRLFPYHRVVTISGADHQLFNESEPMRERSLRSMCEYLRGEM
jgi:alpha-beta hydrolase superfamily lysophospholipase